MRCIKHFCQTNYMWLGIIAAFTLAMLIALAMVFCDGRLESRAEQVFYNCQQVKLSGPAPLTTDDPAYNVALDRDRDGLACE